MPQKKNNTKKVVRTLKANEPEFVLKLYITGASPNSAKAIVNIQQICEAHLAGKYALEIIDVYQQAELAKQEQIIALPMLIKKLPFPEKKMIGDMSQEEKILNGLGLKAF